MPTIAVFAGSFCPFTKGHEDILQRSMPLFDRIVIAIGHNSSKRDIFTVEERLVWIKQLYHDCEKIEVLAYQGLTTELCRNIGAKYLIRGVRNASDYAIEENLCQINRLLNPDVETIFIPAAPQWTAVSSSLVRELWSLGADYTPFLSYQLPEVSK